MQSDRQQWLERFLSLTWYETVLRFIATFVAKTSELLLAAGLVVSTANFLTDGNVLNNSQAATAWAWVQALALDSSLGISFYYVLHCLKQRDWVKFGLYLVLTGLLTLVAGSITNVDIFSHAIHTTMSSALARLGFDVGLLSTLRAIAVVGFVLMSRLKDVSLKNLYTPDEGESPDQSAGFRDPRTSGTERAQAMQASEVPHPHLRVEEVALLIHALTQHSSATSLTRSPEMLQAPVAPPSENAAQRQAQVTQQRDGADSGSVEPAPQRQAARDREPSAGARSGAHEEPGPVGAQPTEPGKDTAEERQERLERAYYALLAEGKKVSARALAQRAHVHRSTCHDWLEARQEQEGESA
jgi:hypothetical protein